MSLQDYTVPRDKFTLATYRICGGVGITFPCSACVHQLLPAYVEPCRTCDHNINAVKEPTATDNTGKCMKCTTPKPRDTLSLTSHLFTAEGGGGL